MANATTAYYESTETVDEMRKKIVTLETTIAALSLAIKMNEEVTKLSAQNAEMIKLLQDMKQTLTPLSGWLHRNKWV